MKKHNVGSGAARIFTLALAAILTTACGGGEDDFEPFRGFELDALSYSLNGGEAALNLNQSDLALAGALAAVAAGLNFEGSEYLELDFGNAEPGAGRERCDDGFLEETVDDGIGTRTFLLEADQCYFLDAGDDSVIDGAVRVARSGPAGNLDGETRLGLGGGSFGFATRDRDADEFTFGQAQAVVSFETQGSSDLSQTFGGRLILGDAAVSNSSLTVSPQDLIEILAGTSGTAFRVETSQVSGRDLLEVAGPVAVRGQGLNAGCNVSGRFNIATSTAVELIAFDDETRAVAGLLTLTAGAATATVQFNSSGGAVVITPTGTATYSALDVDTHCGLDA